MQVSHTMRSLQTTMALLACISASLILSFTRASIVEAAHATREAPNNEHVRVEMTTGAGNRKGSQLLDNLRVFYINMDEARDKRAAMEKLSSAEGLDMVRWPGVALKSADQAWKDPRYVDLMRERPTPKHDLPLRTVAASWWPDTWHHDRDLRVFGCYLAHRTLYEHLLSTANTNHNSSIAVGHRSGGLLLDEGHNGSESLGDAQKNGESYGGSRSTRRVSHPTVEDDALVLVLEDDVRFVERWRETLVAALSSVPEDWDVLRLGYWGTARDQDHIPDQHVFRACPPSFAWGEAGFHYMGTHAVLLRMSRLRHVVRFLDSRQNVDDLDVMMTATCNGGDGESGGAQGAVGDEEIQLRSYVLDERLVLAPHNDYFYGSVERARNFLKTMSGHDNN